MAIPENYTPTPGDKLTKDGKALYVHWIKGGEVGYGLDYGRGDIEALHRRPIDEFSRLIREQGLALVTANVEVTGAARLYRAASGGLPGSA